MLRIIPLLLILQGCSVTGQSVGMSHGFSAEGDSQYHSPHYTVETEKVNVGVQYYRFNKREDLDFMEVDWDYKF